LVRRRSVAARLLGSRVRIPLNPCFIFVVCCVGIGPCDELITGSEESHCVCARALVCLIVCDLEISIMRQPEIELDFCVTKISNGVLAVCYNMFDGYTPLEI
jgi:hypothetical protein